MSQVPEHKLELESQFVLRLPQSQANALRSAIRSGEPLSKRLSIKFDTDIRHGCVKFDEWTMPARLYDLPTIIESYKTLDRKNFYKTADVSQILICKEDDGTIANEKDEEAKKAKYDNLFQSISGGGGKREFLYSHGITPPLKNVRKRRFRKTLKKKYVDFSEIEKEVKRLFKFDCEAIESRYEIVEETKSDKADKNTFGGDGAPSPMSMGPSGMQSAENSQNIDVHELFGEGSSSDDSDDDDDDDDRDDDVEIEAENDNDDNDSDDNDMEEVLSRTIRQQQDKQEQQQSEPVVPAADIAAEVAAASDLIAQNDDSEEKKQELNRELSKIRERIHQQENEMKSVDNETLRMRLKPVLDSLHHQENEILDKLDKLS